MMLPIPQMSTPCADAKWGALDHNLFYLPTKPNHTTEETSRMESFQAIEKINSTPNLSAGHFEDGTIKLKDVLDEVYYLKQQIATIRQEMSNFLTGLANVEPTSKPQRVFEETIQRVSILEKTLEDYVERYKKLVPLLEVVQREMDLKVPDKLEPSIKPASTPATQQKKPVRKRSYTKKSSGETPTGFTPQIAIQEGGTEGQPILL